MNTNTKINKFTDLTTWQVGHKLVVSVYKATKSFQKDERFSLVDQMRRCVVSITSNIAEGFNRQSNKEKIQFYFIALGSCTELQNQLLVAKDVGYLKKYKFDELAEMTISVAKLLNGLIRSVKNYENK